MSFISDHFTGPHPSGGPIHLLLCFGLATGCTGGEDTGEEPDLCLGGDEPSLQIGYGVAGDFNLYEEGSVVGLTIAPQGGFGVPVRAKTTGLVAATDSEPNAPMAVLLDTYIDGEISASFLNETAVAYCQDDGTGLVWDLVVGFDADKYTNDNLIDLHGVEATLLVEAYDVEGRVAQGTVTVTITLDD